ncbi:MULTISPECIES: ABC transporter substrate-binding protein [unclassified Rothia (in: high G+C Gram-positive bacteria)]|uniref:ABC transporter substrate-binding protein n=1 Tax=unclassified Rothia (in: high G+C Gram-positive bacteria) TaxID=2689056 RepID=UPI001EF4DAD8|nr:MULTISPECIES: ABC transporter substrate-binding protein [unclassified Rothia (in: high G+C Gram-positive bacteria)]
MNTPITSAFNRRGFFKVAGSASAALAFAAGVSACGNNNSSSGSTAEAGADAVNKDGVINAGIAYDVSTSFDPAVASGAGPMAANLHIFEGLTGLDPATRERYNALAASDPEMVDDTTYRVVLRDGAKFHDGSPVTANDVVSTFNRFSAPESLFAQFLYFLDSTTAVDEKTVEFKLNQAFPLFADRISLVQITPASAADNLEAFGANPIGSGPYKFVSATKGAEIKFERFEDYNGPRPALAKTMNWSILADAAARVTAMQSKRVQAIESVPYDNVKVLENSGVNVESVQSFGLLFLMFNCEKAPFDKKEVRQALFYGIDMDKVITNALLGNATAATSFLHKEHKDYVEASTVYTYDKAKAQQLLKDAGAEGISFTIHTTDHDWVKQCSQLVQESLKDLGLNVTISDQASAALYSDFVDSGNYDVVLAPGDPSVFGNDADLLLSWWYRGTTWPEKRFRWSNTDEYKQVQELMNSAVMAEDPKEDWKKAIDIIAENAPLYPLFHRKLPTAWDGSTLNGFKPLPTTGLSFQNVGSTQA